MESEVHQCLVKEGMRKGSAFVVKEKEAILSYSNIIVPE